jgi:DNA-binding NarL/FixJ family response regulator
MKRIRVLIVDDQTLFAEGMRIVLEGDESGQIEVVGIAFNGQEAVNLADELEPDVVLMDVRMPVMNGVEATRIIHERQPDVRILMRTTFCEDDLVESALGNGAAGYVLKEIQPEELVESIRAVSRGFYLVSESVGSRLFEKRTSNTGRATDPDVADLIRNIRSCFPDISRRESEVLSFLYRSYDNTEIARELFLAEQTVKNYITAIYTKLGVNDRVHCTRVLHDCLDGKTASSRTRSRCGR